MKRPRQIKKDQTGGQGHHDGLFGCLLTLNRSMLFDVHRVWLHMLKKNTIAVGEPTEAAGEK